MDWWIDGWKRSTDAALSDHHHLTTIDTTTTTTTTTTNHAQGTKGTSNGLVPMLRVFDVTGACVYRQ